jgi:hypothetical protein
VPSNPKTPRNGGQLLSAFPVRREFATIGPKESDSKAIPLNGVSRVREDRWRQRNSGPVLEDERGVVAQHSAQL